MDILQTYGAIITHRVLVKTLKSVNIKGKVSAKTELHLFLTCVQYVILTAEPSLKLAEKWYFPAVAVLYINSILFEFNMDKCTGVWILFVLDRCKRRTRYRASISMYSLIFRVRVMLP